MAFRDFFAVPIAFVFSTHALYFVASTPLAPSIYHGNNSILYLHYTQFIVVLVILQKKVLVYMHNVLILDLLVSKKSFSLHPGHAKKKSFSSHVQ